MLSGKSPLLNCRSLVFVFILILGLFIFLLVAVSSEQAVGQSTPPPNTNCPGEGGGVCDTTPAECTNSANPPAVVGDETGWKSDPPIGGGTTPTINDVTTTWGSTVTLTVTNAPTSDDDTPTRTELIQHYKSPTPPECDPGIPNGDPVQGATEDLPTQSESITLSTTPSDGSFNESTFEFTPPDPAPGEECVPKTFSVTFIWDDSGSDPDRDDTPLKAVGNITVNPNVSADCPCNGVSPRPPDILGTTTEFENTPVYSYGSVQGDSVICALSNKTLTYNGEVTDTDTLKTSVTTQSYKLPEPPECDPDIADGGPETNTTSSTVNDSISLTWSATGPDFVLNGNGTTATFTAVEPGEYAVSLLVDDAGTGNRNDGSKTITHNITAIELSGVAFEGDPKLCAGAAAGETVTIQATATILPASRSIRWSMPNAPAGFSIDEGTGLITVTSEALIGETGPVVRAEDYDSGLCYEEAAIPVLQPPTITITATCPANLDNGAVGAWVGDDLSLTVTTDPPIDFSWEVDGTVTTPADNDADVDVPTVSSGNIKYTVKEEFEGPTVCPLASAEINIVIADLSHLAAGGKTSAGSGEASTVFLAKDGWDETSTDSISQAVSAITTPAIEGGQIGNWTAMGEGASMEPSSGLNSSLTSTKFANHSVTFTPVACGGGNITAGPASMNIAVGGVNISTANISESQEMSETYNIFLNENFDQELAKADPAGHQDCLEVDHSDDSLQGDAPDEYGQISFAALTHGDSNAKVVFETSTGGGAIKLYKSLTERLNFGTEYTIASLGETANFLVEGVTAGEVTLTAKLRTQDYSAVGENAEAIDEIKIKVIPLNLLAVDPAPSSDEHEICHAAKMVIQINDNDSDQDEILDLQDSFVEGNDPDLAHITVEKPTGSQSDDFSSSFTLTLPSNIIAYANRDKTGASFQSSVTLSYNDLPFDMYLEGTAVSTDLLDQEITIGVTLNSGVTAKDDLHFTIVKVDAIAYRPQHNNDWDYYAPLRRTPVDDIDEEHIVRGPGIRVNRDENDNPETRHLIEMELVVSPASMVDHIDFYLRRGGTQLEVYFARSVAPDKLYDFAYPLIVPTEEIMTVWASWPSLEIGSQELFFEARFESQVLASDTLNFHRFESMAILLGGNGSDPYAGYTSGMFTIADKLYELGYDAFKYNQNVINPPPAGPGIARDEAKEAIEHRGVDHLAIVGHSYGGGSIVHLANRLTADGHGGTIDYTGYVDAIVDESTFGTAETTIPASTAYHVNLFEDKSWPSAHGVSIPGANIDLDVNSVTWGTDLTHTTIDDDANVISIIIYGHDTTGQTYGNSLISQIQSP